MTTNEQHAVRTLTLKSLAEKGVANIETNVIYATATKPRLNQA